MEIMETLPGFDIAYSQPHSEKKAKAKTDINTAEVVSDFATSFNAFDDNIAVGGIRNILTIRALACFLVANSPAPVTKDLLLDALLKRNYVNYFEAIGAIDDLIKRRNIIYGENDVLLLSDADKSALPQYAGNIPANIREDALEDLTLLFIKQKNAPYNKAQIIEQGGIITVNCRVLHNDLALMELNLYAADLDMAQHIKERFESNPVQVYSKIVSSLY